MIQIDIPMPESCKKCPIPYWDGEDDICPVNTCRGVVTFRNYERDEGCPLKDITEDIKKLQTYKMFEGEEETYVSLEEVLEVLEG